MCGIAGVLFRNNETPDAARLRAMAKQLAHRGPDGEGVQTYAGCGLAHRRLSIIDLTDAASQPMESPRGTSIVFNGEIYNFRELRRQLEAHGHSFRSSGDTEVILAGYDRWGEGVFSRLDGMFAIALWDPGRSRLVLARDRTGKKPLFVYEDEKLMLFASEVKALMTWPGIDTSMWPEAIPQFLAHGYVPTPASFWNRVRKLRPATFEVFEPGRRESAVSQYWEFPLGPERRVSDLREVEETLRDLFLAAVKRRMVADVPLGAFLSGGIDSTLVVAGMATQSNAPVKTFSIGFEGQPDWDETSFARLVAQRYSTDHTEFKVSPKNFELIDKLAWHYDEPFGDSSAIPTAIVSELTRKHVTVALTGDGGDEIFAGYPRFAAASAAEHIPGILRQGARQVLEPIPPGRRHGSWWERSRRFAVHASLPLPARLMNWVSLFTGPELDALLRPDFARFALPSLLAQPYATQDKKTASFDTINRILFLNARTYLLDDLNVKVDRASMAASLETRAPFLDTALMEYAFSLPGNLKIRGTTLKWVLKRAMADLLPDSVVNRKKMGFGVPLGVWFRNELKEPLRDRLLGDGNLLHQYVRRDALVRLYEQHQAGKRDLGLHFWAFWMLEIWLRTNKASMRVAA